MNEFFDDISRKHGPLRLSKGFLDRLGKEVESVGRALDPTREGTEGHDSSGFWRHLDKEVMIWGEIGAGPTGSYTGYSWTQREFNVDGAMVAPADPMPMAYGDNGSEADPEDTSIFRVSVSSNVVTVTTGIPHGLHNGSVVELAFASNDDLDGTYRIYGVTADTFKFYFDHDDLAEEDDLGSTATRPARQRFQPAFDANGSKTIPSGTKVLLMRAFLNTSATDVGLLPLILEEDEEPTDASIASEDTVAAIGREWVIVGVISQPGGGAVEMRITGRPYCDLDTGHKWYPAVPFVKDETVDEGAGPGTSGGWTDGEPVVWLRANFDQPLGTDGNFVVTAWPDVNNATKDISGDVRPVFGTHDRIVQVNTKCVGGRVTPVLNGTYQGCGEGGMWESSMHARSMFPSGMFV